MKNNSILCIRLLAVILPALFFAGCATNLKSSKAPHVDISVLKTFYVQKLPADNRGIEKLIAERLQLMGFEATYGADPKPDHEVDAVVTYQDKWMWDLTMYMLELNVQVREPANDFVMLSGNTYRTSLVRKSPPEMVEEVLTDMFKQ